MSETSDDAAPGRPPNTDEPDLGGLDETYAIVAEERAPTEYRTYLATRRSDGAEAMLTVLPAAVGGANNALSHYASDTKILAGLSHPGLLQPLDGRWLGARSFVVVTARPHGQSLRQIADRGERLSSPRIAMLLQDVNAVLEWAREQGIVHRGVTLDGAYVDPGTGRVKVWLTPTAIPPEGVPDAIADAQTIGRLAWSLLAGRPFDIANTETLAELRPDLSERVVEETVRMCAEPGEVVHPLVHDYLGVVAADAVFKETELELAHQRADYEELQRVHRETVEAARVACDLRIAEGEQRLAADRADMEGRLAADRTEMENRLASERKELEERLAAERAAFERESEEQRRALASETAQLAAERLQLEYDIGKLETRRLTDRPAAVAATPLIDETVMGWPDVDRRDQRRRYLMPVMVLLAIVASVLVVHFARSTDAMPNTVSVGSDTLVPTPPATRLRSVPRGGFLTQSAAGTVAPRVGLPVADSIAGAQVAAPLPRPHRTVRSPIDTGTGTDTMRARDSLNGARRDTLE